MFSWWGSNEPADQEVRRPRRTVMTKQVHVEVIGGSSYSARNIVKQPLSSRTPARTVVIGPPKLPSELIRHIILLAADILVQNHVESNALLRLASIDRSAHHAIFTNHILCHVRLTGLYQVMAFARDLQRNVLGLQHQVKWVKRLTVRRGREGSGNEDRSGTLRHLSLYSGLEELAQFEKATVEPLKAILSYCIAIEHLSLDMPARVLDKRNREESKSKVDVVKSLKELITLLSVYGGDLNEALWNIGTISRPRWSNLTHLQLHGPRFRMTSLTALAISQLPSLTHLALIMPLLVQSETLSTAGSENEGVDYRIEQARDALGRCNVLQILIDAIGHRLQTLLLVCHDVETYVGNVQKLGSWFRTLHWRCDSSIIEREGKEATKLILVTAKPKNPRQTSPHPSLYSKWMLQRAEEGVHWNWNEGDQDFVGYDVCEEMQLAYSVESWTIPIVYQDSSGRIDHNHSSHIQRQDEQLADNDTARRWLGLGDNPSEESSASEELSGLDNLD